MKSFIITILAALGLMSTSSYKANDSVQVVPPQEFQQRLSEDSTALLLDVRRLEEFAEGHLQGARLMNWLDREVFEKEATKLDKAKTVYVYCRSGRRSNEAINYLAQQGYKVVDMQGGYLAWTAAGLPIEKPRTTRILILSVLTKSNLKYNETWATIATNGLTGRRSCSSLHRQD